MAKKLNTDLDKAKKKKLKIEDDVDLDELELDEDAILDEDDLLPIISTTQGKKSKKKKKGEEDADIPVIEELPPEEGEEDMTGYEMGNIMVNEGNSDEPEEDVKQLISAVKGKKNDDDDDDEGGDVWINDFDGLDAKDPYLDGEKDYDPDNDGFSDE